MTGCTRWDCDGCCVDVALAENKRVLDEVENPEFLEKLVELEHEQWMVWSKSLINQILDGISPYDTAKIRNRLLKKHQHWLELWKSYNELSENEKDQDRIWARKVVKELASLRLKGDDEK